MKFKLEFDTEIPNDGLLEIINDFQDDNDLDNFGSLEECSEDLIFAILDDIAYWYSEIEYLDVERVKVTVVE